MVRRSNLYVLLIMVAGMVTTACAMIVAVLVATARPSIVVLNNPAAGQPSAPGAPAAQTPKPAAAPAVPQLTVHRVSAVPPAGDPLDPAWDAVPSMNVPLQPQNIAMPALDRATISALSVQAARDSGRVAWRISWPAARPATSVDAALFCDAVAIQLGASPEVPYMMGGPGKPVRLLHWKAIWQRDIDQGFQDVQDLHPNYWADMYWFSEGRFPYPVSEAFRNPVARQWLVASAAGNPMSDFQRKQPVEELIAEGFGTSTHVPSSLVAGRGVWKDGRWTVIIERALAADDPLTAMLQPGTTAVAAFAAWDGSAGNVGGRKHWCNWIPLKVSP